mmetsp:Transcript_55960/g.103524  ORF Transcript_55960/g.103524 Transcript_55960/m.103524 type:complete len:153 (+) Transcript_55960:138-596(+)
MVHKLGLTLTVLAALSISIVRGDHCLLQADMERLVQDKASIATEEASMLEVNATRANGTNEVDARGTGDFARPNGPALMNRTLMSEKTLPEGSRHANMKTYTADWRDEYPQPPAPPVVAMPTVPMKVQSSGANMPSLLLACMIALGSMYMSV